MTPKVGIISALLLVGSGCANNVRFADQPIVWRVDDQQHIAEPEEREYLKYPYFGDIFFMRRTERLFELRDHEPAHNVNALDEVPSSSWFENRIGVRTVPPKEAARGPATLGPPKLPLTVVRGKSGGGNPGFVAKDKDGRSFIIKFDTKENPELQSSANLIVNRVLWTVGYHVPADYVFYFNRADLSIAPDATAKNALGDKLPFDEAMLEETLKESPLTSTGSYRATASEYLDGIPKGGWSPEGVRDDDPNDRIAHEHRRELRGLRVFAAWLNHTDMKEDNTLDMYVEEGGRHFIRHYLVDFGEALGGHAAEKGRLEDGWEYFWDWSEQGKATFAFGLWKRPWESIETTKWESVGPFVADPFVPNEWKEAYPYFPFFEMDASDAFWAAKIAIRVRKRHLEEIVREAQLSERAAAEYLVKTLEERRDAVARTYLEALSPLDELRIDNGRLCGVDLSVHYQLVKLGEVEWVRGDQLLGRAAADVRGRFCLPLPMDAGYHRAFVRVRRGREVKPPLELHYVGGADARIVGIIRDP